jgi:uridine kinase
MNSIAVASAQIIAAMRVWQAVADGPLVVAVDGHGAAGKTTLATESANTLGATLIHTDDFFHAARPIGADELPMAQYYDWARLRAEALEPALADGKPVILVEGVSAGTPALSDLVTRAVFVQTPEPVRLERLHRRLTSEEWDEQWLAVERMYFRIRPPECFDLIVSGATSEDKITR